jgi:2-methylcitrate dehydratase
MNTCQRLAAYSARTNWDSISPEARGKLKQHVLDTLGCALGAIPAAVMASIRSEDAELALQGKSSLIGGGKSTPERAAFYNGALVRYLDFMDTFIAPGEACHPSDNFAGILTAAELASATGTDFLAALALAYHVQCSLTASGVHIMRRGFDHTLQLGISLAAGMSRVMKLTEGQTAHAIALCAASSLGSAAARSGEHVPQWKGLASAATAFNCIHNVRLAQKGITGPLHIFEGPMGLEQVLGRSFNIDWSQEGYDGIMACSIKRHNAEFHAQTAVEAMLELRHEHYLTAGTVNRIQVDLFKAGCDMIGGGKYVDAQTVATKEDADHSLPYLISVALIDGEVTPDQFTPERIASQDVQELLPRVVNWLSLAYTREYPNSLKCNVRVETIDGRVLQREKDSYPGFFRQPMPIQMLIGKFNQLAKLSAAPKAVQRVIESVAKIEERPISELIDSLSDLGSPENANTAHV